MKIRENAKFCEKCGINITDFEILTKNRLAEIEKELRDKFEKDYVEMEKKLREKIEKEHQQSVEEDLKKIETNIQKEKKQDLNKPEKIMKKFDILMCCIIGVLLSFIFTLYLYIVGGFMDPILNFIIFSISFSVIAYLIVFVILKIKMYFSKK